MAHSAFIDRAQVFNAMTFQPPHCSSTSYACALHDLLCPPHMKDGERKEKVIVRHISHTSDRKIIVMEPVSCEM